MSPVLQKFADATYRNEQKLPEQLPSLYIGVLLRHIENRLLAYAQRLDRVLEMLYVKVLLNCGVCTCVCVCVCVCVCRH